MLFIYVCIKNTLCIVTTFLNLPIVYIVILLSLSILVYYQTLKLKLPIPNAKQIYMQTFLEVLAEAYLEISKEENDIFFNV